MRREASGNAVLFARIEHGPVLIAFVQRVIRAFDKDLTPLHQRSGEKSGECANDNLLKKRGVHPVFESSDDASNQTLCGEFGTRFAVFRRNDSASPNQRQPKRYRPAHEAARAGAGAKTRNLETNRRSRQIGPGRGFCFSFSADRCLPGRRLFRIHARERAAC